jgi:hypothetical protein
MMLDGQTRLGDLVARPRSVEARLNLTRLVYLLVHSHLATVA